MIPGSDYVTFSMKRKHEKSKFLLLYVMEKFSTFHISALEKKLYDRVTMIIL